MLVERTDLDRIDARIGAARGEQVRADRAGWTAIAASAERRMNRLLEQRHAETRR